MKKLDFVDVVSYNTVLKAYLGLSKIEEAQKLLREMSARGLPANKVTYNELLHARVLAKDRRGMWGLLDEMRSVGVKANAVTCSILLKSLTENSHPSDAEKVMYLVEEIEEDMDEVLFSSVIEACIRLHRLDLLSGIMKKFEGRGRSLALTAPTYGSMIKAYGQSHDIERIWELWHEMGTRGVKPTAITLGCMVDALVMNNRVEDAWQLVNDLLVDEELAASVNTVIFSTVLKGFAMVKQTDKVFAVHKEMCDRQIQCNTITYNTMFDACARCGTMDRVPKLLEDMRISHAEPDIITYSTLVKGFCLTGDVDRAFRVLEEMKSDGKFAPDEIMYNSLLDGCAKLHRVEDAQNLLDDMREHGVNPSNYTLSILVKLFGRTRRLNQAFKTVEELSEKIGLRPNIHVYTCLMQACIHNRQIDRALGLHDTMVSDGGIRPDEKCYSVLVRGCLQSNRLDKAVTTIRCAFGLTGHSMATSRNGGAGVERSMVAETLAKLKDGSAADQGLGRQLLEDLEAQGHHIDQEWSSQSGNGSHKGSGKGGMSTKGGFKGGRKGKGKGGK
jgi:pentatricopeptide repeat protein